MKVLMICLGNICRSPLAEGILKHKIHKKGLDWQVDSAGVSGWHEGELPDHRSIATAKAHNIDLTDQRSRPFELADFEAFDKIFVMDASNYQDIIRLAKTPEHKAKVDFILNQVRPNYNQQVPDPYYNNQFELVFQLLDEACDALIKNWEKTKE